jgi:hypothetical protein
LLFLLYHAKKKDGKPLLSRNAAWCIAHFEKDDQPRMLAMIHADKLWWVVDKYKDSQNPRERGWAVACYNALKANE